MSAFLDRLPHGWSHINGSPSNGIVGEIAFRQQGRTIRVQTDRNVQIGEHHIVGDALYVLEPARAYRDMNGHRYEIPREIEDILRLVVDQPRSNR